MFPPEPAAPAAEVPATPVFDGEPRPPPAQATDDEAKAAMMSAASRARRETVSNMKVIAASRALLS